MTKLPRLSMALALPLASLLTSCGDDTGSGGDGGNVSTGGEGGEGGGACVPEDDNNDCTDDVCAGDGTVHDPVALGARCSDETAYCDGAGQCVACLEDEHCTDGDVCGPRQTCVAPTCMDGSQNGVETDVDCGGAACDPCDPGQTCNVDDDCESLVCDDTICQDDSCNDTTKNGDETDIDCGGSCPDGCDDGAECAVAGDCVSGVCSDDGSGTLVCQAPECGDLVVNGLEACDDGNPTSGDGCDANCTFTACGNGIMTGVEDCDDGNADNTDACLDSCEAASCGDGFIQAGVEDCDDGNVDNSDACLDSCVAASCGDGFVRVGVESCDDGNGVDTDQCSNTCAIQLGTIQLGGTSFSFIQSALATIGEPFVVSNTTWLSPNAADVLIMSNDGAAADGPDYTPHLNAGKHVLMFGGSGSAAYRDYWVAYFAAEPSSNWHQSNDCVQDWNKTMSHPMVALLPATYEFPDSTASWHMLHFTDVGQPSNTILIGRTCHQAPNNNVLVMRRYDNGGTLTYMAFDLGPYAGGVMQQQFVVPFIQGYFDWLESGAP